MILYHGSPNKFNTFDYSKIRTNGTSEGLGFYFTTSESVAKAYSQGGYIYTVELNGRKALSDSELTITKREAETIIRHLHLELDYLSNFGDVSYEGFNKVLRSAMDLEYANAETDTDFMGSLYNACGENELVITSFYELLGFDHVVSIPEWGGNQTIYIALTNDIIKIIDIKECVLHEV